MFIYWGTNVCRRTTGEVTEFCPVHRTLHPFELVEVATRPHLYGISIGRRTIRGYEIKSEACPHQRQVDPAQMSSAPPLVRYAQRLHLEHQILTDPTSIPADIRRELLQQAVADACQAYAREPEDKVVGRRVWPVMAAGVGVAGLLLAVGLTSGEVVWSVAGMVALLIALMSCAVAADIVKRRIRRAWLDDAARLAIAPLRCGVADVRAAVEAARAGGIASARLIDIDRVAVGVHGPEQVHALR